MSCTGSRPALKNARELTDFFFLRVLLYASGSSLADFRSARCAKSGWLHW